MGIDGVNLNGIKSEIESIAEAKNGDKKETLDEIAKIGKRLIKDLNEADKTVYEIVDDYDESIEEFEAMQAQVAEVNQELNKTGSEIDDVSKRIAELEARIERGEELSEAENNELQSLYASQSELQEYSNKNDKYLGRLTSKADSAGNKINNYNNTLNKISDSMGDYKAAGEELKNASKKYGKKNMNVEKAMDWNEKTAVSHVFNIATAASTLFGVPIAGVADIGISITTATADSEMNSYLEEEKMSEISENTFYNAEKHEFKAEFDVLEEKGGNHIDGEKRRGTAQVYSYGKTIESASEIVKKEADEAK